MSEEKKKWVNPHLPNKQYDHSKAAKLKHLFPDGFIGDLDIPHLRSPVKRRKRAHAVMLEFLKIALEECAADNSRVVLPCHPALILYIRRKPVKELAKCLKTKGVYTRVSLFRSDGNIYEYALWSAGLDWVRPVRVSYTYYQTLIDRVNAGQRYRER